MAKSYKLKKAYIKQSINLYLIRLIMFILSSNFPKKEKVLIKSSDGIGDQLIRSKLAEMIQEKYGKENCIFLLKEHYLEIGKWLGYNCIGFSKKEEENFFSRLKKMYQLNMLGIKTYINLEFGVDITVGNILADEKIGITDKNPFVSRSNVYYTKTFYFDRNQKFYILDLVAYMARNIVDKDIKDEDIVPNLKNRFPTGEKGIVLSVGTSSRYRVTSPYIMAKYLEIIIEKYPNEKIYLLGNGKLQEDYANKLIELLGNENIENLVDKTTIERAFETISKSKLFIGFDSGMYNFAFTIRKNSIGLFEGKNKPFLHNQSWIKVIFPDSVDSPINDREDKIYANPLMNSISLEKFEKTMDYFE
ncbi:MAG: glycosyltransferase family 9 protein, partial [Cetobacterium sp.]